MVVPRVKPQEEDNKKEVLWSTMNGESDSLENLVRTPIVTHTNRDLGCLVQNARNGRSRRGIRAGMRTGDSMEWLLRALVEE